MELLQYEFMRNAFLTAILINIACGIVGTYIVVKRIVFISGGISHAAFGGIGLGYLLGINPILATIPFTLGAATTMATITRTTKISEDTAIGILWTVCMSLGIIFISLTPGYAPDLFSYLFGNILTVPTTDLGVMLTLDIIIILTVLLLHKEFTAICFDEEYSEVVGIPTKMMYTTLLCLVALSVVVLIRAVGIILVIALLTIPATITRQHTHNLKKIMVLATLTGATLTITGLLLSYKLDTPPGATIVIILALALAASTKLKK
ncbi:MAG: metal ABC transporter permease [Methanobacteriota archaeon]|nr:MAG: metal ABC transporter permease [Euryarchaeota archaeon]